MNKVYRVIWSKAHNTWVAVSEITKAHGKNNHSSVSTTEAVSADSGVEQKSTYGPFGRSLIAIAISFVFLQGNSAFAEYEIGRMLIIPVGMLLLVVRVWPSVMVQMVQRLPVVQIR